MMRCSYCGKEVPEQYANCPYCGAPLSRNGWQTPVGSMPGYGLMLTIGILYMVCCCNLIFGLIGIIFTVSANSKYKIGDLAGFTSSKKAAQIVYIVGILLYVGALLIGFFTGMLGVITSAVQ